MTNAELIEKQEIKKLKLKLIDKCKESAITLRKLCNNARPRI